MALQLSLAKPGDAPVQKLALNLNKGDTFSIELRWDSDDDLDAHALLAFNNGSGAKISSLDQILSTYNAKVTNSSGTLNSNPDGSFSTPDGSARHSGDALDGGGNDEDEADETITIYGAKVPSNVNEIPIFITIHPAGTTRFAQVRNAGIRIKNSGGKVIGEYHLTNEFGNFDAVQMGSLILENGQWSYLPAGSGFNGDFNFIIGYFS